MCTKVKSYKKELKARIYGLNCRIDQLTKKMDAIELFTNKWWSTREELIQLTNKIISIQSRLDHFHASNKGIPVGILPS